MFISSGVPKDDINWLFALFTDNGFMMVSAVLGFVSPIVFVLGLVRGWWYTGTYVRAQKEQLDAANAFMQLTAASKTDEQTKKMDEILAKLGENEETNDREFRAIERREEAVLNDVRELKFRQGGGNGA